MLGDYLSAQTATLPLNKLADDTNTVEQCNLLPQGDPYCRELDSPCVMFYNDHVAKHKPWPPKLSRDTANVTTIETLQQENYSELPMTV